MGCGVLDRTRHDGPRGSDRVGGNCEELRQRVQVETSMPELRDGPQRSGTRAFGAESWRARGLDTDVATESRSSIWRRDVISWPTVRRLRPRAVRGAGSRCLGRQRTGLMPGLRAAQQESDALELAGRRRRLERLAGDTARTMQSMAVELHPPAFGTLGLLPARQNHRTDWGERHSIDVDIPLCGARAGATSRRCREHAPPRDAGGAQQHPQTRGGQSREPHAGSAPGGVSLILEDDSAVFDVEGSLARPERSAWAYAACATG